MVFRGNGKELKSPPSPKSTTPIWSGLQMIIQLSEAEALNGFIDFHFFDKGGKLIGGDKFVGSCSIECNSLLANHHRCETQGVSATLMKKNKERGNVVVHVEATGWRVLYSFFQNIDTIDVGIDNMLALVVASNPKIHSYIQEDILVQLSKVVLQASAENAASINEASAASQGMLLKKQHSTKKINLNSSNTNITFSKRPKRNKVLYSSTSDLLDSLLSSEGGEEVNSSKLASDTRVYKVMEIISSLCKFDVNVRSRLIKCNILRVLLQLVEVKDITIQLHFLECFKAFFTVVPHQKEMVKVGVLSKLIQFISKRNRLLQLKALEILLYFDDEFQIEMISLGIMKKLIKLLRHSNHHVQAKALEVIQYFNSKYQSQIIATGFLKELIAVISLDSTKETAENLIMKVLSVIQHFDASHRQDLIQCGILEALIGLLNVANPRIQLRALEVIDGFGDSHEKELIEAGILNAITKLINSDNVDIKMKGFDTITRFRKSTKMVVESGILNQLVLLLGDHNSAVQARAFQLLSSSELQISLKQLVDVGIIAKLLKVLSTGTLLKPAICEMAFDLLSKLNDDFHTLIISQGAIEAAISVLQHPSATTQMMLRALEFLELLAVSSNGRCSFVEKGVVEDLIALPLRKPSSGNNSLSAVHHKALNLVRQFDGWITRLCGQSESIGNLMRLLQSPVCHEAIELIECCAVEVTIPSATVFVRSLLENISSKNVELSVRCLNVLSKVKDYRNVLESLNCLSTLFATLGEDTAFENPILNLLHPSNDQQFQQFLLSNNIIGLLLNAVWLCKLEQSRIQCVELIQSFPNYSQEIKSRGHVKQVVSLLGMRCTAVQLRAIDMIRSIDLNFPPLLQEFIVQKLIRLVHSGLSLPVQKAALQCLEQLHKENVLFTYLKSHSEAELLDSIIKFNSKRCHSGLELSNDNTTITASTKLKNGWRTAIADKPIVGVRTWEVVLEKCSPAGNIMIGVAKANHDLSHFIGESSAWKGWAYYGAGSGYLYHDGSCFLNYGGKMKQGMVIGVTVDTIVGTLSFSVNGKSLGIAFSTGLKGVELYPAVSLYDQGDSVTFREPLLTSEPASNKGKFLLPSKAAILNRWIGESPHQQWQLIYKASLHGWSSNEFHRRCDKQGPTITLIKMKQGAEFGGYASMSWEAGRGFKADPNAFLFTLANSKGEPRPQIHPQFRNQQCAIFSQVKYGPTFGIGYDMHVNLDDPKSSYIKLGHTFKRPTLTCETGETEAPVTSYMAGTQGQWGSYDVEVYSRYNEPKNPATLKLLNHFIRLLQIDNTKLRQRIEEMILQFFRIDSNQILVEMDQIITDRRSSSQLRDRVMALQTRLAYPGFRLLPTKLLCIDQSPVSGQVNEAPVGSEVLFEILAPENGEPHSDNSLPLLTHIIVHSSQHDPESISPLKEALVYVDNDTTVSPKTLTNTEASFLEAWPEYTELLELKKQYTSLNALYSSSGAPNRMYSTKHSSTDLLEKENLLVRNESHLSLSSSSASLAASRATTEPDGTTQQQSQTIEHEISSLTEDFPNNAARINNLPDIRRPKRQTDAKPPLRRNRFQYTSSSQPTSRSGSKERKNDVERFKTQRGKRDRSRHKEAEQKGSTLPADTKDDIKRERKGDHSVSKRGFSPKPEKYASKTLPTSTLIHHFTLQQDGSLTQQSSEQASAPATPRKKSRTEIEKLTSSAGSESDSGLVPSRVSPQRRKTPPRSRYSSMDKEFEEPPRLKRERRRITKNFSVTTRSFSAGPAHIKAAAAEAAAALARRSKTPPSLPYVYLNDNNKRVRYKNDAAVHKTKGKRRFKVVWTSTQRIGWIDSSKAVDDCGYVPVENEKPPKAASDSESVAASDDDTVPVQARSIRPKLPHKSTSPQKRQKYFSAANNYMDGQERTNYPRQTIMRRSSTPGFTLVTSSSTESVLKHRANADPTRLFSQRVNGLNLSNLDNTVGASEDPSEISVDTFPRRRLDDAISESMSTVVTCGLSESEISDLTSTTRHSQLPSRPTHLEQSQVQCSTLSESDLEAAMDESRPPDSKSAASALALNANLLRSERDDDDDDEEQEVEELILRQQHQIKREEPILSAPRSAQTSVDKVKEREKDEKDGKETVKDKKEKPKEKPPKEIRKVRHQNDADQELHSRNPANAVEHIQTETEEDVVESPGITPITEVGNVASDGCNLTPVEVENNESHSSSNHPLQSSTDEQQYLDFLVRSLLEKQPKPELPVAYVSVSEDGFIEQPLVVPCRARYICLKLLRGSNNKSSKLSWKQIFFIGYCPWLNNNTPPPLPLFITKLSERLGVCEKLQTQE